MSDLHVLIVGGGITGLLLAQGLKKNGVRATVVEGEPSADHYRQREWGMSIQWALPILNELLPKELLDRLQSATTDPSHDPPEPGKLPTFNAGTGEHIKDLPLVKTYRVSRRKFRALCAEGIDVQYNKKFGSLSFDSHAGVVIAKFEDGTDAEGSLLVGTDGAQSAVRTAVFGLEKAKVTSVPYCGVNLHVKYGDPEKAKFVREKHPTFTHAIHPDGYWIWMSIQDVPDPADAATWTFQLQCTWQMKEDDDPTDLTALKKKAENFAEPFKSAFLWIPEGTTLYANFLSYWEPRPIDDQGGLVTLAGDAAHPMTFHRGQGMNHGIADAAQLVKQLIKVKEGSQKVDAATSAYEAEMVPRAGEEVKLSLMNTQMLHDWSKFMNSPVMQKGGNSNVSAKS